MLKQTILVDSPLGIHLRPATAMCDQAIKYKSKISFNYGDGKTAKKRNINTCFKCQMWAGNCA